MIQKVKRNKNNPPATADEYSAIAEGIQFKNFDLKSVNTISTYSSKVAFTNVIWAL